MIQRLSELQQYCINKLSLLYPKLEANSITTRIIEFYFGYKRIDQHLLSDKKLNSVKISKVLWGIERLMNYEPLQYITNEAFFLEYTLKVNPSVLIPRPETEELAELIINKNKDKKGLKILDIGTGSGCIAIALNKKLSDSQLTAIDISEKSLKIAKYNAKKYKTPITFRKIDLFNKSSMKKLKNFDIVVSNPPYVLQSQKKEMHRNVIDWEPSTALFVKDNDPLVYYREILKYSANGLLVNGGLLYFECNEDNPEQVKEMMKIRGFKDVNLVKDLSGKDRMVWGKYI